MTRSIEELNNLKNEFWRKTTDRAYELLRDPAISEIALQNCTWEVPPVPGRLPKSIYEELYYADKAKTIILKYQGRRGGSAKREECALRKHIREIVRAHPDITHTQLLKRFKDECQPGGFIDDIDEHFIDFIQNGVTKRAKISGLKHRLSRAKKR